MADSAPNGLPPHLTPHIKADNCLIVSSGTASHKVTVVIEPPARANEQRNSEPICEDDYSIPLLPTILKSGETHVAETNESITSLKSDEEIITETQELEQAFVPVAIPETPPPATQPIATDASPAPISESTSYATILPFKLPKATIEPPKVEVEEAETPKTQTEIETPTPKPSTDVSEPIIISNMDNSVYADSKLVYSTAFSQKEERTTGMSPPSESYAYSPSNADMPLSDVLSYSQATHGSSFSGPETSSSSTTVHFGAYAGPSTASTYAGAVRAPLAYASSN